MARNASSGRFKMLPKSLYRSVESSEASPEASVFTLGEPDLDGNLPCEYGTCDAEVIAPENEPRVENEQ